jgi:hypothetical protein
LRLRPIPAFILVGSPHSGNDTDSPPERVMTARNIFKSRSLGRNRVLPSQKAQLLPGDLDLKILRAVITRSGGESVAFPE